MTTTEERDPFENIEVLLEGKLIEATPEPKEAIIERLMNQVGEKTFNDIYYLGFNDGYKKCLIDAPEI